MNFFRNIAEKRASGHYTLAHKLNLNFERIITEMISDKQEGESQFSDNHQCMGMIIKRSVEIDSVGSSVNLSCDIDNESTQSSTSDFSIRGRYSRYVISKRNRLKRFFDLVMDLMIYYSVVAALDLLGFFDDNQITNDVDYFVWAMFAIDFFLNFCTEYTNKQNQIVKNFSLIALNYCKTWMIFDILALLPFSWIGMPTTEYFLRLLRIFKMKRFLKKIDANSISNYMATIFYKFECIEKKRLRLKIQYGWNLLRELLKMIFCAYLFANLWLYYVRTIIVNEHPSDNFLVAFNIQGLTKRNQFFKTCYFIFSTFMTVGYGDFYATNTHEMVFCIFLVIIGPTWFAFSMGRAIGIINRMKQLSGIENKMEGLNMWISNIERRHTVIPAHLRKKIHEHFLHFWRNDRLGSIYSDPEQRKSESSDVFFQDLPTHIKSSLTEYLFDDIFYKFTYFFRNFKEIQNEIALLFQPRFYNQNSTILEYDADPIEIFFKIKGHITIGHFIGYSYIKIATISETFIVGDLFAFQGVPSSYQFKAKSKVQGFSIPVLAINLIIETYQIKLEDYIKFVDAIYTNFRNKISKEEIAKHLNTEEELRRIERYCNKQLIDDCVLRKRTVKRTVKKHEQMQHCVGTIIALREKLFVNLKEKVDKLLQRVSA